jgi:hypothetical protein
MKTRQWEVGDVTAILVNPFYAIEIHTSLSKPHEHPLTEARWVASNQRAIHELGCVNWLRCLLEALKIDHGHGRMPFGPHAVGDPYPAITVHPTLCLEHPPLIDEDKWVRANVRGLEEGVEIWLHNLLSVLKGAFSG